MKKTLIVALGLVTALSLCAATGCSSSTASKTNTSASSDASSESVHDKTNTNVVEITTLSSSTKAGDYVEFGKYSTDAGGSNNAAISWLVLNVKDGQAELLATAGLDAKPFNDDLAKGNTYATSDIKTWLEGDFKTKAFSSDEQAKLVGQPTLLTAAEAEQYFSTDSSTNETTEKYRVTNITRNAARCLPTDWAVEQGALKSGAITGDCDWWLQDASTEGEGTTCVKFVNNVGEIRNNGCLVNLTKLAVRPVITVKL